MCKEGIRIGRSAVSRQSTVNPAAGVPLRLVTANNQRISLSVVLWAFTLQQGGPTGGVPAAQTITGTIDTTNPAAEAVNLTLSVLGSGGDVLSTFYYPTFRVGSWDGSSFLAIAAVGWGKPYELLTVERFGQALLGELWGYSDIGSTSKVDLTDVYLTQTLESL